MIGYVVSVENPSTKIMTLYLTDKAKVGQIVVTQSGIVGRISEIEMFCEPLSLASDLEFIEDLLEKNLPSSATVRIGKAQIIRNLEGENVRHPPLPGEQVREVTEHEFKRIFGLGSKFHLGYSMPQHFPVSFDFRLFAKHMAILAMSGAGKSNLVAILVQELLKEKVPVVIIDVHGEYLGFQQIYSGTQIIKGSDIKLPLSEFSEHVAAELIEMTEKQKVKLSELLRENDLYSLIKKLRISSRTEEALAWKLKRIASLGIINELDVPEPNLTLLEPGSLLIVDMSEEDQSIMPIRLYALLKMLFEKRKSGEIPPLVIIIEEAHNFAPEGEKITRLSRKMIEKIAREGRKFGIALVLVSQRPAHLSQTALAQCNNHVFLRIVNPNDLEYVKKTAENLSSEEIKMLPSLNVGEGIISGECVASPILVKFRRRPEILEKTRNKTFEELLREWKPAITL